MTLKIVNSPKLHKKIPLDQLLSKEKILNADQISLITQEHRLTGRGYVRLLLDYQLLDGLKLQSLWHDTYEIPPLSLENLKEIPPIESEQLRPLTAQACEQLLAAPYYFDAINNEWHAAFVDCMDIKAQDFLRQVKPNAQLVIHGATPEQIHGLVKHHFPKEQTLDTFLWQISSINIENSPNWAIECVNYLLNDALQLGASDIHLQPQDRYIAVRYRLDGVLMQRTTLHSRFWPMLLSRLKILSQMNTTISRMPQMGRMNHTHGGRLVDCRLSSHPIALGESMVIRLLDMKKGVLRLEDLGLPPDQCHFLQKISALPEGLIVFTGPTGSGKSTSLYALLQQMPAQTKNIVTLEDPIEYELSGIRQSQVDEVIGFSFEAGVRSLLRQDPDVILIGEIRDEATAKMALRAALTGHLVLTTLHTNSVFGILQRFQDLGIEPANLAGILKAVVSQRLVRCLCQNCKTTDNNMTIPGQCPTCQFTGFKGRKAIAECLMWDRDYDEVVYRKGTPRDLESLALQKGFISLATHAQYYIEKGLTNSQEVGRVIELGGSSGE